MILLTHDKILNTSFTNTVTCSNHSDTMYMLCMTRSIAHDTQMTEILYFSACFVMVPLLLFHSDLHKSLQFITPVSIHKISEQAGNIHWLIKYRHYIHTSLKSSINLDSRVDLTDEGIGSKEADSTRKKPECENHDACVSKV